MHAFMEDTLGHEVSDGLGTIGYPLAELVEGQILLLCRLIELLQLINRNTLYLHCLVSISQVGYPVRTSSLRVGVNK